MVTDSDVGLNLNEYVQLNNIDTSSWANFLGVTKSANIHALNDKIHMWNRTEEQQEGAQFLWYSMFGYVYIKK